MKNAATLNAALGELGSTIAIVGKLKSGLRAGEAERPGGADAERRLLRAVFRVVRAPIFLLERDGAVRRVDGRAAATVLGVRPAGHRKPFTAFAAPQDRRAVRTQLTAILRTGRSRLLRCRLAGTTGTVDTITFLNSVIRKGAATDQSSIAEPVEHAMTTDEFAREATICSPRPTRPVQSRFVRLAERKARRIHV